MRIVFKNSEGVYYRFEDRHHITLPAGKYMLAYTQLSESEYEDGDRLDNLTPDFVGQIEKEGEFTVLNTGAEVEFWISGYNDYDRCDPYFLKSKVTIT
ncbi:MAG: hypothetical protein UW35_C0010G0040 [Candidatus Collierbacteria bacterium GW2011_GWF2_44_15]|uniref:Uncharacterized protein n=3 Tax=Candidatus Collieribacteriota TaxID=1752725 RepID=A0A0G1HJF9_9BACT|nr:MAG: hypothetical protein UW23_C0008G0009 [Candidatus Collierbacteria bacterium GW2011_GWA1_44_12]KKT46683.1 MAG: hypothetical protein UW35_C0010G0040 [Candidatus Collierbacteria bacterium GW2011_GWF2_44_15]KKU29493.1 MAG: hypothetical protein UX41_C0018G0025 [Candidatus Collierbacteria bacterium GW2011_GWE1_46_18]